MKLHFILSQLHFTHSLHAVLQGSGKRVAHYTLDSNLLHIFVACFLLSLSHSNNITFDYSAVNKKYQMTNVTELLQERLKISINAIDHDTSISQIIKNGFKMIYECLYEQGLSNQVIEAQLLQKASCSEMHYSLSQKLSVSQFLNYFQKIEKVINGFEVQSETISNKIEQNLLQKYHEMESMLENERRQILEVANRCKKEQEGKKRKKEDGQIDKIKMSIKELEAQIIKVSDIQEQNKENVGKKGEKGEKGEKQMYCEVIQELKVIQEYCEDNRKNIDDMMQDMQKKSHQALAKQQNNMVSFSDLRSIMANLEQNLSDSLQKYMAKNISQGRVVLEWSASPYHPISFTSPQISTPLFQTSKNNALYILESGIYNLTCGFFPAEKAELKIKVNGIEIAHHICSDPPENNVARTIMLHLGAESESEVKLQCLSKQNVHGFFSLQKI